LVERTDIWNENFFMSIFFALVNQIIRGGSSIPNLVFEAEQMWYKYAYIKQSAYEILLEVINIP